LTTFCFPGITNCRKVCRISAAGTGSFPLCAGENKSSKTHAMNLGTPATGSAQQKNSLSWLALAVGCFHAAYTSIHFPAAGLLIFGYAFGLVKLCEQNSVRRAFYFDRAAAARVERPAFHRLPKQGFGR
jgi:hypothetical protein